MGCEASDSQASACTAPLRAALPLYSTMRLVLDPGVKLLGVAARATLAAAKANKDLQSILTAGSRMCLSVLSKLSLLVV